MSETQLPVRWRPIAFRMPLDRYWRQLNGAVASPKLAQSLVRRGLAITAQRRDRDCTVLLIKAVQQ